MRECRGFPIQSVECWKIYKNMRGGRTKRKSLAPCRMSALEVVVVVILAAVELSGLYVQIK